MNQPNQKHPFVTSGTFPNVRNLAGLTILVFVSAI